MVDKRTEWPNRVREHRLAAKLSIARLAEDIGISQPMLGFIERGLRDMRFEHQKAIAKRLGLHPGDLLNESDLPSKTQDERELLDYYRRLDPQGQRAVLGVAESLTGYRVEPEQEVQERKRA